MTGEKFSIVWGKEESPLHSQPVCSLWQLLPVFGLELKTLPKRLIKKKKKKNVL